MELVIGLLIYLAPAAIALTRSHPKFVGIGLLNVLLGWTVVGWVIALVWAFKTPSAKAASSAAPSEARPDNNLFVAKGAGGTMTFNGREVIISRKGALSFLIHGFAGEKSIAISAIQAVQLRPARYGVRGYLQLTVLGGVENRGGAVGAAGDENSVLFDTKDQPAFEAMAATIRDAIHQKGQPLIVTAPISQADELAKLAELRDRGVLTEEEFQMTKRALIEPST